MEAAEKTKTTKSRRQIDWQSVAIYTGSRILEGGLVALGGVIVNRGIQTLMEKPKVQLSNNDDNNVVSFSKSVNR